MKDCENYHPKGFCLKDIGEARVWDCTCKNKNIRSKMNSLKWFESCKYPKLGRNINER